MKEVWAFNEGGRFLTTHFILLRKPWVQWQARIWIMGLSFCINWKW